MVRLPFTERDPYASPYPIGIAVAHIDLTGDATGGTVLALVESDGGFLFRIESISATRNDVGVGEIDIITSLRLLTDRSGLGAAAFDLNWHLNSIGQGGFSVYTPFPSDLAAMRKLIMGRTDTRALQTLFSFQSGTNTNGILMDFDLVCSYWPVTALIMPGFLEAFYEAPIVASPAQ